MSLHLLQCVDVNSISLYDSDVRRENLETFGVLPWDKLLTQDLQNLTEKGERGYREGKVSSLSSSKMPLTDICEITHLQDSIKGVS